MGKVTSKYQVSIPKTLAEQLDLKPGDEIHWRLAGDELRIGAAARARPLSVQERLKMFDDATKRQAVRDKGRRETTGSKDRGWKREDLYDRGRTR
jgi:AbrB family looped-hinge helix DNA binding protein